MCKKLTYSFSFVLMLGLVLTSAADAELVGWWKLDDGSGTVAVDSSGYGRDGTITNATWDAGKYGAALAFDGTAYVDLPADAWSSIEMQATFTFWAYGDPAFQPQANFIFGAFQDPPNNESRVMSAHVPWSNSNVYFDTGGTTAGGYDRISKAATPAEFEGSWQHWAFVKNGDTGDQMIYLNGVLWHSGTGMTRPMTGVTKFTIGTKPSLAEGWYNGMMDDVRLFDHALTEDEILAVLEGAGAGFPNALGPDPANGAMHEATWVNLGWRAGDFAVSHDVYLSDNLDDVSNGTGDAFRGNQGSTMLIAGFAGFAYPDGLVPGKTYYWRIDEVNDADPNSPWKGDVWSFSIPPKTAYNPDPSDGAEFVDPNAVFTWTPGFGGKLHTVYVGTSFDDVDNAAGGVPLGSASYDPGTLESEKVYYWRVDEFDPPFTHKGDVWGFTTPGAVGNPQPANGAVDVQMIETLNWTPADNAASHELYFGTDADAVKNATTASPEYVGPKALGAESYDPGGLAWDSSYAWRVDEVYPTETIKGLVWSFSTADFILVDDFESYNDIDPPDAESNRIFDKWIDGFGTTTNGALVGNDLPPYAEQTIVHGGAQSMPYLYDNNLKTSEATLTLVYPKDWTAEGVTKLSLWFRGASGNAADRMFVAVNGSAVVYHDDPAATQITGWNEWVIDLQDFAGVNLANVDTITIAVGTKNGPAAGGTGTMYFDDIRLVR
ncbi:MAG: LamG domain-containing protein [Phycisphaerae bacterium]|nr:LamG domain-containing protein [Phycisphaerae bacterium]